MSNYLPSLQERKRIMLEDAAMSVGASGFQGSSDASGPTAGYDPLMGKPKKKKKVEEGYESLPSEKMQSKSKEKEDKAEMLFKKYRLYIKGKSSNSGMGTKRNLKGQIKKEASKIKKMKTALKNHDPIDKKFQELENRDRGERKSKQNRQREFSNLALDLDGKYRKNKKKESERHDSDFM